MASSRSGEHGRPWRAVGGIALLALCWGGCTSAIEMDMDTLLDAGRNNEILAYEAYHGESIRLTGQVAAIGLKRYNRPQVKVSNFGGWTAVDNAPSSRTYAVIALRGTSGRGAAVCFFSGSERKEAGKVSRGDSVTVVGIFERYVRTEHGLTAKMAACEIERVQSSSAKPS